MINPEEIKNILEENIKILQETFQDESVIESLRLGSVLITDTFKQGGKLLICGNGGSAADAQHIAGEMIGRFKLERRSFPAIALTTDSTILTCVANDYSFEDIFRRQVEGLGKSGDVLLAISTSGNSENVIRAVDQAKQMGFKTVSLTGGSGGKLKDLTDLNINIHSKETPYIQSGHCIAYHIICEFVEKELANLNES